MVQSCVSNPGSPTHLRVLEARGVSPCCGNVLVFPHGDTAGSLVHEGSAVTKGVKYVIRTDVLYLKAKGDAGDGRGALGQKTSGNKNGQGEPSATNGLGSGGKKLKKTR